MNTSHASLLSFLASSTRYDPHKWPHESTLFCSYLKTNGGQDKRKVDSCIGKHVGPLERGQIKCGDVEVENPISTS